MIRAIEPALAAPARRCLAVAQRPPAAEPGMSLRVCRRGRAAPGCVRCAASFCAGCPRPARSRELPVRFSAHALDTSRSRTGCPRSLALLSNKGKRMLTHRPGFLGHPPCPPTREGDPATDPGGTIGLEGHLGDRAVLARRLEPPAAASGLAAPPAPAPPSTGRHLWGSPRARLRSADQRSRHCRRMPRATPPQLPARSCNARVSEGEIQEANSKSSCEERS